MGADLNPNLIIPRFSYSVNLDKLHARNHFLFYSIQIDDHNMYKSIMEMVPPGNS